MSTEIESRMADLEKFVASQQAQLRALQDREAIREVLHTYCRAADRADAEMLRSCYWPDAFDDHGFFGGNAWEFVEYVAPLLRETTSTTHAITNPLIDLDGDTARVESQVSVTHRLQRETGHLIHENIECRYLDVFEKRGGEWRIFSRVVVTDGIFWSQMHATELVPVRGLPLDDPTLAQGDRHPRDPVYRHLAGENLPRKREALGDFWSGLREVSKKL